MPKECFAPANGHKINVQESSNLNNIPDWVYNTVWALTWGLFLTTSHYENAGVFTFSKNITLDPFFSNLQKLNVGYLWAELFHTFGP